MENIFDTKCEELLKEKEGFDIQLIYNGSVLSTQKNASKEDFKETLAGTTKSFGKENVTSKYGKDGYIKVNV